MDENTLAKLISDIVKEELNTFKQEVATKEDLKIFATKEDIEKLRSEMATKENLKSFATKDDLKPFATKDDLKPFATKDDLKLFATKDDLKPFATKDDLKPFATKDDLKLFATKEDFLEMESRLSSALQNVREGVRLSLIEVEHELREIKSKLRFYDFDYLARQNDALAKVLKDLYEEKTLIATKLKEHESRIGTIEAKI